MNNTYSLVCRSGKRYFVNATASSQAVEKLERHVHEHVLAWELAEEIPSGATVLN